MSKVGARGVQSCLSWFPFRGGDFPSNAVCSGGELYVARAWHEGELIPGKFHVSLNCCYLPYGGEEHNKGKECEILIDTGLHHYGVEYEWVRDTNGNVPKRALVGGFSRDNGEPLYIARANVDGEAAVGKVHRSHGCAYFPYRGREHRREEYEVLVMCKN